MIWTKFEQRSKKTARSIDLTMFLAVFKALENALGGNRTPIIRTGILCDIHYTTSAIHYLLYTIIGF